MKINLFRKRKQHSFSDYKERQINKLVAQVIIAARSSTDYAEEDMDGVVVSVNQKNKEFFNKPRSEQEASMWTAELIHLHGELIL